jgi:hypothetical protein
MVSKRLSIFGFISAAALVSGVLIGCGGSGGSTANVNQPSVKANGGMATVDSNPTASFPTSNKPQQVQVASGATVVVPPGQPAITPASTLAIIPAGTQIVSGFSLGVASGKVNSTVKGKSMGGDPGEIYVGYSSNGPWLDTGVNVSTGILETGLAFAAPTTNNPNPNWLAVQGPFTLTDPNSGNQLTVNGSLKCGFNVFNNGATGLPVTINLKLPANGATAAGGNYANVVVTSALAGAGTLNIAWTNPNGSTGLLGQARAVNNGTLSFSVTNGKGGPNDVIPAGGVDGVVFNMLGIVF